MKGLTYDGSGNSVQGSFKYLSHTNLSISATASTTAPIESKMVWLSLTVAAHVRVGSGDASVADFVFPAGVWPMYINRNSTISVIQLTGSDARQASVVTPEE